MVRALPSSPRISRAVTVALGLAIGLFFFWVAARGLDWAAVASALAALNPGWALLGFCLLTASAAVRSARWHLLLSARLEVSFRQVFWANMAGYAGNALLPLRAGEVVRAYLIGADAGDSKSYCLASAVVERILDVIILAVALLSLLLLGRGFPAIQPGLWVAMLVAVLAAGGAVLYLLHRWRGTPDGSSPGRITLWQRRAQDFAEGALSIAHGRRAAGAVGWSILAWALESFAGSALAAALQMELSPGRMFSFLAILGIASSIPSAPGYTGTYQLVGSVVLVPFGWSREQSVAFASLLQALVMGMSIVWGLPGLVRFRGRKREFKPERKPIAH